MHCKRYGAKQQHTSGMYVMEYQRFCVRQQVTCQISIDHVGCEDGPAHGTEPFQSARI